jgi:hypothetical protein
MPAPLIGLPLGARLITGTQGQMIPALCPPCTRHLKGTVCVDPSRCTCLQCAYAIRWQMVDRHLAMSPGPARESLLYGDMVALRAFDQQRHQRAAVRMAKPAREPFPCACGRVRPIPGTDQSGPCMVTGARMPFARYAGPACKEYGRRARLRAIARAQAQLDAQVAADQAQRQADALVAGPVDSRSPRWR